MRLLKSQIDIDFSHITNSKNYTFSFKKMFKTTHNLTSEFGRTPLPISLYDPALHEVPETDSSGPGTFGSAVSQCTFHGSSSLKPTQNRELSTGDPSN